MKDLYLWVMVLGLGVLFCLNILRFAGVLDDHVGEVDLDDSDGAMNYLSLEACAWFLGVAGITGYWLESAYLVELGAPLISVLSAILGFFAIMTNMFITKHFPRLLTTPDGLVTKEDLLGLKGKTLTKVDSNGHGTVTVLVKGKIMEYVAYSDELIPTCQEVIIVDKVGTKLKVRKT